MSRIDLILLIALVVCALSLVSARYQERRLYAQSENLMREALYLETERDRLEVERTQLIRSQRILQLAESQLGMKPVKPLVDTMYYPMDGVDVLPPGSGQPQLIPVAPDEGRAQ